MSGLIIKVKKGKGSDGYKIFSIRLKDELVESIDEIAVKTCRSRNELIGILLEYSVNQCEISEE